MDSITISGNGIDLIKTIVEEALSTLLKTGVEVDPDDQRLLSIYDEITTLDRDIDSITEEEITDCVTEHYVAGYLNSEEVIEDIEIY